MIMLMTNRRTELANLHIRNVTNMHDFVLMHVHQAHDNHVVPVNEVIGVWSPDVSFLQLLHWICRNVLDWIGRYVVSICTC